MSRTLFSGAAAILVGGLIVFFFVYDGHYFSGTSEFEQIEHGWEFTMKVYGDAEEDWYYWNGEKTKRILTKRLNKFGVRAGVVRDTNPDRFRVRVEDGISDEQLLALEQLLSVPGRFSVYLEEPESGDSGGNRDSADAGENRGKKIELPASDGGEGEETRVTVPPAITEERIAQTYPLDDHETEGQYILVIEFDRSLQRELEQKTSDRRGLRLIIMVEERVVKIRKIEVPGVYGKALQLAGYTTEEKARARGIALTEGPLDRPLKIINRRTLSSSTSTSSSSTDGD